MAEIICITVWNEFNDEKQWSEILVIYPGDVHKALERFLK
jgi:trehalose utilization protein